jgi:NADH:ubiquinone oxidoreductase subunit 2 (subunit N)
MNEMTPASSPFSARPSMVATTGWALIAAVNTVISLCYYPRIIGPMYVDPRPERATASVAGRLQGTVVAACVVGAIAIGVGSGVLFTPLDGMLLLP